ncbi:adenosylmethionine decarboxylase [Wielerella bovis]|uniref:adenosylmethionine decarboxylase n=1 Tax=Wielerella bovis TaxID=2917790 RepID=UPI002018DB9F|nr:adenosylmethionine decarboxylase [Wielerella bovis]ULJ63421.1 adenosylmethionine decarboxylase [Wielerella bovis]ULJ65588.1 adenosylmethionine decarboxylase [Wielerella bovis]ULJ66368.1 adenosylmethionine decarboxylase [Wielerella bovis]
MSDYRPSAHGLLDLYGCPADILRDAVALEQALRQAAHNAQATILSAHFHTFGGHGGVTGVVLLAESHITIHTWAEHGFAAVDVFLCGSLKPQIAAQSIQAALFAQTAQWREYPRGENLFQAA